MLQRGIENARFPRFPVDAGHGQGHQVMIGADAARHRDNGGTVAHHGEEERVFQVERRQVGHGLHDAEGHEQVHRPDAQGKEQKRALVLHAPEAAEALPHGGQRPGDLRAEPALRAEMVHRPEKERDQHHDHHEHPPERELEAARHGLPHLLQEEGPELVAVEHQRERQHEEDGHDVPEALHQHRAEHAGKAGLAAHIAAAQHLARPGQAQVREVAHVVGVPRLQPARLEPRGAQEQPPAERPEHQRPHRSRKERHQPEPLRHLQALEEGRPVHAPQRQPEQHTRQRRRKDIFQNRFNVQIFAIYKLLHTFAFPFEGRLASSVGRAQHF